MSESPQTIMQDGIRQGYSGLRPGPNPHAVGTLPRALWDKGWQIGDTLRRQHEAEIEAEIGAIVDIFNKALR